MTVREGNKTTKMPANQAPARNMWLSAIKGDRRAQRMGFDFMNAIEREACVLQMELYVKAVEYKSRLQQEFALSDAADVPRSEPVPHPDDIDVDARTGAVRFMGPVNREEMIKLREAIRERDVVQQLINDVVGRPGRMKHRKSIRLLMRSTTTCQSDTARRSRTD